MSKTTVDVKLLGPLFATNMPQQYTSALHDAVVELAEVGEDLAKSYWTSVSVPYTSTIGTFTSAHGEEPWAIVGSMASWLGDGPPPFHPGAGKIGEKDTYVGTWLEEGRRRRKGDRDRKGMKSVYQQKAMGRSLYSARKARGWYRWRATFRAVDAIDTQGWFGSRIAKVLQ